MSKSQICALFSARASLDTITRLYASASCDDSLTIVRKMELIRMFKRLPWLGIGLLRHTSIDQIFHAEKIYQV